MTDEEPQKSMTTGHFVLKSSMTMIKHKPLWFVLTSLSSLIFFTTPLLMALAVREIFDVLEGVPRLKFNIWTIVWIIPVIYVVELITDSTFAIFVWRFNQMNTVLLRKNMIKGVFRQPGSDALEKSAGETISRFRGDVEETVWFTSLIGDIIAYMIFAIISFLIMYEINAKITVVVFIPFIFVVIMINRSSKLLTRFRRDSRRAAGRVTGSVGENFGAIQAIKVASAESNVLNHFRKLNNIRRDAAVKDSAMSAGLRSIGKVVVSISTGVILLMVATLMQVGEFTLGDFTLFIFLLNWLTGFITFLGEFFAWYHRNRVSYDRMLKIMKGKKDEIPDDELMTISPLYLKGNYPEITYNRTKDEDKLKILEIENLGYKYANSDNGIDDINLRIEKGTFNVIVGRVGSGKSTLIKAFLGLLPHQTGTIKWNDKILDDPSNQLLPPRTAYTSQIPVLFSDSIEDNIMMGIPNSSVDIGKSLELAVVNREIDLFEDKLNTKIGPKGVRLSGGQKHRVAAARMFVREPELLIFDDLSSALDVKTEEILWQRLFKNKNNTYLVTSHRKYVLNRADQIIVLKDGRIIDRGNITELLDRCSEMQALWEGKFSEPHVKDKSVPKLIIPDDRKNIEDKIFYPSHLMIKLEQSIPKSLSFSLNIYNMYENLIEIAMIDNEITAEELDLLENILSNVVNYSKILNIALKDNIIDKKEKEELRLARETIYEEAYNIANRDNIITSDENNMLIKLLSIIKELGDLKFNNIE